MNTVKLYFRKINKVCLISIIIVAVFSTVGISFCSWYGSFNTAGIIKTGQLELFLDEEGDSSINVDISDENSNYVIPFTIINNSTMPVKEKSIICRLDDEEISEICSVDYEGYDSLNDEINGQINLDLASIQSLMMSKEGIDENLLTEPTYISSNLNIEMKFAQANINTNGWEENLNFDICINKTIMPVIPVMEENPLIEELPPQDQIDESVDVVDTNEETDEILVPKEEEDLDTIIEDTDYPEDKDIINETEDNKNSEYTDDTKNYDASEDIYMEEDVEGLNGIDNTAYEKMAE